MVLVETAPDRRRARSGFEQVDSVPRSPERDGRLVEEQVDVERPVGLTVPALLDLLDEPNNRRVPLGERLLVGERGCCGRAERERQRRQNARRQPGLQRGARLEARAARALSRIRRASRVTPRATVGAWRRSSASIRFRWRFGMRRQRSHAVRAIPHQPMRRATR
jgi:hypothetical protein